ncbi:MAG: phasin family protein [Rhodospirillaceae bacterium]|nr:phasin family protein [Rhodospirillales bacterium]
MAARKYDDKDPGEHMGEAVVEAGRQTRHAAESAAEAGMGQATEMNRRQTEQMRALVGTGTRMYSDLGEFSRGDVDTLVQTSARLAKGVQDMSWEVMNYTQQSFQLSMKTANDLMTCRTIEDMLNVHRNFMRQSVDTFLQESARLLEMSSGVTNEVASPMQQRAETMRH